MTNAPFSKILLALIASVALACAPHEALAQRGGRGFGGVGAFYGGGFHRGFVGVSGGFGGFRGGFGRFGGFPRPFFAPGFRGQLWVRVWVWLRTVALLSVLLLLSPLLVRSLRKLSRRSGSSARGTHGFPSRRCSFGGECLRRRWQVAPLRRKPGRRYARSSATAINYTRASDSPFTHNANVADARWHRFSESRIAFIEGMRLWQ